MANYEKNNFNPEQVADKEALEKIGIERQHELQQQLEKLGEHSKENLEDAKREALEKATEHETIQQQQTKDREPSVAERRHSGPIGKAQREASYNTTMNEVQSHMSAPSRAFSKVIHNKAVEKVSDVTGATIARPNAILAGSLSAFVLTLSVYVFAKNIGYPLSGFETIGAFILGWIIGLLYDFLKVMITGRK